MSVFRFGSADYVSRVDAVDDAGSWWFAPNAEFARSRRITSRPGTVFVAHYKAGDLSENPVGLPTAVLFVGIDGPLLYRVTLCSDDHYGRDRFRTLVMALLALPPQQRAAWAVNRIVRLSSEKPYMGIGLDCLPLEMIVDNQVFRTRLTNLLEYYTATERDDAEEAFAMASFNTWLTDTARLTSLPPGRVVELLHQSGQELAAVQQVMPRFNPIGDAVRIMPHGVDAVLDAIQPATAPVDPITPSVPQQLLNYERRRRRSPLTFLEEESDGPESEV